MSWYRNTAVQGRMLALLLILCTALALIFSEVAGTMTVSAARFSIDGRGLSTRSESQLGSVGFHGAEAPCAIRTCIVRMLGLHALHVLPCCRRFGLRGGYLYSGRGNPNVFRSYAQLPRRFLWRLRTCPTLMGHAAAIRTTHVNTVGS